MPVDPGMAGTYVHCNLAPTHAPRSWQKHVTVAIPVRLHVVVDEGVHNSRPPANSADRHRQPKPLISFTGERDTLVSLG